MFQVVNDIPAREHNNTSLVQYLTWIVSNLTLVPIYIAFFAVAIRSEEIFGIASDGLIFVLPLYWFGLKVNVKKHCINKLTQLKNRLGFW